MTSQCAGKRGFAKLTFKNPHAIEITEAAHASKKNRNAELEGEETLRRA
jgi:hypothetical protein